jgi:beta-glucosidase
LPFALHEKGGWYNRDTAFYFAEYVDLITKTFGDSVKHWITMNEPWIVMVTGYVLGVLAPGLRRPYTSLQVAHNLLLAHGLGMQKIRANSPNSQAGITNALSPVHSYRIDKDLKARKRADALMNQLWLDPIYKGKYPDEIIRNVESQNKKVPLSDDLKIISAPTDFLGINHYSRTIVKNLWMPLYSFFPVKPNYPGVEFTSMGWEIYPNGMYEILDRIKKDYGNPSVYITENGVAFYEPKEPEMIHDDNRIQFLKDYLFQVHRAILEGANVKGYFVWSFMDNFEWAEGYEKTFGLVYVDRNDSRLERTPKKSAYWYGTTIKHNGFEYE